MSLPHDPKPLAADAAPGDFFENEHGERWWLDTNGVWQPWPRARVVNADVLVQERDLRMLPYFHRATAAHRDNTMRHTHVIVGDHDPEPRCQP